MGIPNWELVKFIASSFGIEIFIETGSGHGATIVEALKLFPKTYTVELSDSLFNEVNSKYGKLTKCYHGKSLNMLRDVLPKFNDFRIMYWLDAHWCAGPTAGREDFCPLLDEINEINKRPGNNDFIIIDDAHTFFSPAVLKSPHDVRLWPGIVDIFDSLHGKDRYTVILASWRCTNHGVPGGIVMPEDVIVSVPKDARELMFSYYTKMELES